MSSETESPYVVVRLEVWAYLDDALASFTAEVNEFIERGYTPVGGVTLGRNEKPYESETVLMQAMYKAAVSP